MLKLKELGSRPFQELFINKVSQNFFSIEAITAIGKFLFKEICASLLHTASNF